jgi:hypothetical protein
MNMGEGSKFHIFALEKLAFYSHSCLQSGNGLGKALFPHLLLNDPQTVQPNKKEKAVTKRIPGGIAAVTFGRPRACRRERQRAPAQMVSRDFPE